MMSRAWLCALLLGSVVACKGGDKKAASPSMPTPAPTSASPAPSAVASAAPPVDAPKDPAFEQQTKWLRAFAEAFNKHDADAIDRGYSMENSTKWSDYKSLFADAPDARMALTRSWHIRDVVLVEFVEGGTNEPAGKKPFGYVGAALLWFNPAGQVVDEGVYLDELTLEVQLGTAKPPASKVEVRPLRAVPPYSATWEQHRANGTPEEAKILGIREQLYSKISANAERDFIGLMTDDIELVAYDEPADAKGKKAAAAIFNSWHTMFSDLKIEPEHSWACENFAIFEGTFAGRHTGPWGPVKATKKEFKNHFVDVTRVNKDGKVDRMWTYSNNAELMDQLLEAPTK